jgi:glutamine amidotransferase/cyclase
VHHLHAATHPACPHPSSGLMPRRSGADKVSIGSDAVIAAEEYLVSGKLSGSSSIEQISKVYGAQAVVVSIDPRRCAAAGSAAESLSAVQC